MKVFYKAVILLSLLLFLTGTVEAVTVSGTPPSYDSGGAIDTSILAVWPSLLSQAETTLAKYDNQEKLPKGFANANTYTTNVANIQGYQDYSIFALMTGAMVSLQMPESTLNKDYMNKMRYTIEEDGDLYLGVGTGVAVANIGINAGFIFPGMYINIKYGQADLNLESLSSDMEGFRYKELLLGMGVNQILFWPRTAVPGALRWRGLNVGTGFYYSKTETSIKILKAYLTQNVASVGTLTLDPSFNIVAKSETMTIPLELNTAFVLFSIVNLSLGTGVDFNLGHSKIDLEAAGSVTIPDYSATPTEEGHVVIKGGSKEKNPTPVNPKVIAGIGFNFSIVKLDIPIAVYYLEAGYSVGLSAGIVW